MKAVIIGGGIAGLCMGIYLHKNGVDVSVNERKLGVVGGGHAFLMHHEGIAILQALADAEDCILPGKLIDTFVFKRPDGELMQTMKLDDWQCFKRTDLTICLAGLFPASRLNDGRIFSHFIYRDEKVIAAEFTDGTLEYGDIFIAADGANSIVRQQIFGDINFKPGIVKEVVGIVNHPEFAGLYTGKFTKFQEKSRGLAFGLIPTSETELVWFMQYDPSLGDVKDRSAEQLKTFCFSMLKHFPKKVTSILEANDFTTSYIWNTRDFDLLPRFHRDNVVLIGDAAHLALPFTSAGTTNALTDAKVLSDYLLTSMDYLSAFEAYYAHRAAEVNKHVLLGRELRDAFISPDSSSFTIPLIMKTTTKP